MLGCAQTDEGNRAHNADLMQHGQKNSGSQIEIFSLQAQDQESADQLVKWYPGQLERLLAVAPAVIRKPG